MQNLSDTCLLLSCCAPCCVAVLEHCKKTNKSLHVLFFNPNIAPDDEYEKRKEENKRICDLFDVPFIEITPDVDRWRQAVRGLEHEPEQGARCTVCFALRLKQAAIYAKNNGYGCFSSVLGVSRYKNFEKITDIALKTATEIGIPYDATNWRKGGLQERRATLIKELNIYSQHYCGCPYSMR